MKLWIDFWTENHKLKIKNIIWLTLRMKEFLYTEKEIKNEHVALWKMRWRMYYESCMRYMITISTV